MSHPLHLFQAFGVELEYMIVDAETLSVRPISDQLIHDVAGEFTSEIELGEINWSNELALHVVELKTGGPAPSLAPLAGRFQEHVARVNSLLAHHNARLMPTAMHPWMDPDTELKLWPHEYNAVYEAYHRIFDCRGHGWANLQSVHLNLPFGGDEEFGRLHAAIRLILPILPALAASSPVIDRRVTGLADNRLEVYRHNARRVPSVAGQVVPEPVFTQADYERLIFQPMYDEIAPLDPDGVLRHEFLNSRGAIARFDRNAIEIRVLDVQECPRADLAICTVVVAVLRAMCAGRWTSFAEQCAIGVPPLSGVLLNTIRDADRAAIADAAYLRQYGWTEGSAAAGELWRWLIEQVVPPESPERAELDVILRHGPLSRRIERALAGDMQRLPLVYRRLCDCLAAGEMFI